MYNFQIAAVLALLVVSVCAVNTGTIYKQPSGFVRQEFYSGSGNGVAITNEFIVVQFGLIATKDQQKQFRANDLAYVEQGLEYSLSTGDIWTQCQHTNITDLKKLITHNADNRKEEKDGPRGVQVRFNCNVVESNKANMLAILGNISANASLAAAPGNETAHQITLQKSFYPGSLQTSFFYATSDMFNARIAKNKQIDNESSNTLIGITVTGLIFIGVATAFSSSGSNNKNAKGERTVTGPAV